MTRTLPRSDQLPYALYRAAQVRELDRIAIQDFGIPGETLMERAGTAAFSRLRERWPGARDLTVVAGQGNNGGDGLVVARLAKAAGLTVRVLQVGDPGRLGGDARTNLERYLALDGDHRPFERVPRETQLVVDGLFGTGLDRPVEGPWAAAIDAINASPAPVLALDIPSGLHADTGCILGSAVRAELTLSFIGLKQGLFTADGPDCCGTVLFDGLDVPAALYGWQVLAARRIDWPRFADLLPPRPRGAHKGHFGHVLVVGGDLGMAGAARLAGEAALRTGAGLVSVATRPEHVAAVVAARPELMTHAVAAPGDLAPLLARATVVALGPGLGRGPWGRALLEQVLGADRPLVVDADALSLLAESPRRRSDWVLTPHPGEAARLLALGTAAVHADRFAAAAALQQRYGGVVVLKGAGSIVQGPGTRPPAVCSAGNPGMATGGVGDVLTGIVAGLMAQGLGADDAAEMGVCVHAAAGDRAAAAGERGLVASDLFAPLRELLNPPR
jgi:NAD(P)H-hydrate epimerase